MAKKICTNMMLIVFVLLVFILMVMINKNLKESYVAVAARHARVRADAYIYTGPGDALHGPVAPARRKKKRVVVVWYNPVTWRWWW